MRSEVLVAVHVQHARLQRLGFANMLGDIMEIAPKLGMTAPYAPALDETLEGFCVADTFHLLDESIHLARFNREEEIRVAAQHFRVDGQGVQARLIAQFLAQHERHVAVRAIAQQAVDLTRTIAQLHPQHRRFWQLIDHPQAARRTTGQACQRLFGMLQLLGQTVAITLCARAAVDRVRTRVEFAVALQQLLGELLLRIVTGQANGAWRAMIDRGVVQQHLQLAAVLIPVIQVSLTSARRQQTQEVHLCTIANQVEVQPRLCLVRDVAEHVEVDHQLVVGTFQQRVIHPPEGLRDLAEQAFAHRGTVVLAEDRQQRVVVAAPDMRPVRGRGVGVSVLAQVLVLVALVAIVAPQTQQIADVVELAGHGQQRRGLALVIGIGDV